MKKTLKENYVEIISVQDFLDTDEEMVNFEVKGKEILICHVEEETFHAVSGICTHEFVNLCDGELEDSCVICPLHFSRFDLTNGKALDPPAKDPLQVYPLKIEDGIIYVQL